MTQNVETNVEKQHTIETSHFHCFHCFFFVLVNSNKEAYNVNFTLPLLHFESLQPSFELKVFIKLNYFCKFFFVIFKLIFPPSKKIKTVVITLYKHKLFAVFSCFPCLVAFSLVRRKSTKYD